MKCLWIAREIPFPANSGDRIYSAFLSQAFAASNGGLTFVALENKGEQAEFDTSLVKLITVGGGRYSLLRGLLSTMPLVSAVHATQSFHQALGKLFSEQWDVIVFDHYASGWALQKYLRKVGKQSRAKMVYIAHNHEEKVLRAVAAESKTSWIKKLGFWQNYFKVKAMERFMVERVDVVTAITDEDKQTFLQNTPGKHIEILTPGYSGRVVPQRKLMESDSMNVVMLGSFHWAAKQENLRQFLKIADPIFLQAGVTFHVIGSMSQVLRDELLPQLNATQLHGFVDDPAAILDASRIALVPEAIGGGFKLKFLDYIFQRLPVATLEDAASGLPDEIRAQMICSKTHEQMAHDIVSNIVDINRLNTMQENAFALASNLFLWADRGDALLSAVSPSVKQ